MRLFGKERRLGRAETRRYDLPLTKGEGADFLILLIGLMSFLAVLALAATFTLSAIKDRWTSGLKDRATVEIPAMDENGKIISADDMRARADKIEKVLKDIPFVRAYSRLSDREIQDLVKPWLGDNLILDEVPLPDLVSLELGRAKPEDLKQLELALQDAVPEAKLDTHESWLKDLLRFTAALQFAAAVIAIVIGVTAVSAVAGAVQSRMAVHSADVELLHLMGASDTYIALQFQRHSFIMALKGSLCGFFAGMAALMGIGWISGEMDVNLLPDFRLSPAHMAALLLVPAAAALLAMASARRTVLRTLSRMP